MQWHNIEAKLLKQYERQLEEQEYIVAMVVSPNPQLSHPNTFNCLIRFSFLI